MTKLIPLLALLMLVGCGENEEYRTYKFCLYYGDGTAEIELSVSCADHSSFYIAQDSVMSLPLVSYEHWGYDTTVFMDSSIYVDPYRTYILASPQKADSVRLWRRDKVRTWRRL